MQAISIFQCVLKHLGSNLLPCVDTVSAMPKGGKPHGVPQDFGCHSEVAQRTEAVYAERLQWIHDMTGYNAEGSATKRYWMLHERFDSWEWVDTNADTDILSPWKKQRVRDADDAGNAPSPSHPEPAARIEPIGSTSPARMEGCPAPASGSTDGPDCEDAVPIATKAEDTAVDMAAASLQVGDVKASDTVKHQKEQ